MTVLALLLLMVAAASWHEVTRILRYGGGRREIVAYGALMLLAAAVGVAMSLDLPLPNPVRLIHALLKPLGERILDPG